jgi:hypothetical protein
LNVVRIATCDPHSARGHFCVIDNRQSEEPERVLQGVADYDILPPWPARGLGAFIIAIEGFLALSHLTGWYLAFAVRLGVITLSVFFVAVGVNLGRGKRLPCHCFSAKSRDVISSTALTRLLLMLAAEAFILKVNAGFASKFATNVPFAGGWERLESTVFCAIILLTTVTWTLTLGDVIKFGKTGLTIHRGVNALVAFGKD